MVVGALVWITVMVVRLERAELEARAEAQHQEALRLALWRLDSWLAPRLAQEAARPYFEYESFFPQRRAYTPLLSPIEPGEVLTPSPLLSFRSEYFRLHFQVGPDGQLASPQVPTRNLRDLAEDTYLSPEQIEANRTKLEAIRRLVTREAIVDCVAAAESQNVAIPLDPLAAAPVGGGSGGIAQIEESLAQQQRTRQEWQKRKGAYEQNLEMAGQAQQVAEPVDAAAPAPVSVGTLVPFWIAGSDDPEGELMFARRVRVESQQFYQGFVCDWPRLRAALAGQITDLLPQARLVPVQEPPTPPLTEVGVMLATIPVLLEVPAPAPLTAGVFSPVRWTLALTWLAVIVAMFAVAVTLASSIAFGAKRSRFASAVTHELRTPLTTFRMYTEMLAEGMVEDREQRQAYLETLKDESGRLATLVENVLSYARLEDGRRASQIESVNVEGMLARLIPALRRRAQEVGMSWHVDCEVPHETVLRTDVEAVGQILFNLVDNACKYAGDGEERSVELQLGVDDGALRIRVHDRGPGIPAPQAKLIFAPFERGPNGASDKPGIGLGLALSRGLARDLGGDLQLNPRRGGGACFELTLPLN
ncbi:MAG: sensor histidine kinase [Planctomycetota bacterium]